MAGKGNLQMEGDRTAGERSVHILWPPAPAESISSFFLAVLVRLMQSTEDSKRPF